MNRAQKRTWWTFAICLSTLVISAVVIYYVRVNEIKIIDFDRPMRIRLAGLANTIPLIMIVILSARFPTKIYDERDIIIDRKSAPFGYIAGFIFLVAAGFFLFVIVKPLGTVTNIYIWSLFCYLVYLTFYVGTVVSSIVSLVQYYRPDNKSIEA